MDTHCIAIRKTGEPCKGSPLAGRPYCFSHDPELAEQRAEGRAQGGYGKSNSARARKRLRGLAMDPIDVNGLLSDCLLKVAAGEMDPGVGQAVASMSRALMAVQETSLLAEQVQELERAAGIEPSNITPIRKVS